MPDRDASSRCGGPRYVRQLSGHSTDYSMYCLLTACRLYWKLHKGCYEHDSILSWCFTRHLEPVIRWHSHLFDAHSDVLVPEPTCCWVRVEESWWSSSLKYRSTFSLTRQAGIKHVARAGRGRGLIRSGDVSRGLGATAAAAAICKAPRSLSMTAEVCVEVPVSSAPSAWFLLPPPHIDFSWSACNNSIHTSSHHHPSPSSSDRPRTFLITCLASAEIYSSTVADHVEPSC